MSDNPGVTSVSFESLSLEHSSTVDRVADELRRALFDGEVETGTPLREVALAEAMGVSRSTVREALAVLVSEGLALREPNRGVRVPALDAAAVHDVCRARVILEVAGARRWSTARAPARAVLSRALEAFADAAASDASPAELTAAHLGLHGAIVGLTESPRVVAQAETLYAEIRLALAKVDRVRRNASQQVRAHRALVRVIEAGDPDRSEAAIEEHLLDAEASMLTALDLAS
jgi:DNA-binding GntR family transcriptional regulator